MKLYHTEKLGRADAIKTVLKLAKVDFEDHALPLEELQKLAAEGKIQSEFGNYPVLEKDGKFYSQAPAILRYVGRTYGYYPEDPELAWKVDSTLEHVRDLIYKLYPIYVEQDETKKKELGKEALTVSIPQWLAAHEKRVTENGQENHLVGDKLTVADIQFVTLVQTLFKNEKIPFHEKLAGVFAQFPKLNALYDNLHKTIEGL
jgi:glutathione S-transferase